GASERRSQIVGNEFGSREPTPNNAVVDDSALLLERCESLRRAAPESDLMPCSYKLCDGSRPTRAATKNRNACHRRSLLSRSHPEARACSHFGCTLAPRRMPALCCLLTAAQHRLSSFETRSAD